MRYGRSVIDTHSSTFIVNLENIKNFEEWIYVIKGIKCYPTTTNYLYVGNLDNI